MTKPTPEQMLELAKIVEPDKNWVLHINNIIYEKIGSVLTGCMFIPENNPAQLMQVIFALWDKGYEDLTMYKVKSVELYEFSALTPNGGYRFGEGETKQQSILNLAVEALL